MEIPEVAQSHRSSDVYIDSLLGHEGAPLADISTKSFSLSRMAGLVVEVDALDLTLRSRSNGKVPMHHDRVAQLQAK
jgi:hypothetical protein